MNTSHLLTSDDVQRLESQLERVEALMSDGRWRTLSEIARAVAGSEAGVSARLRDLRKTGNRVSRRRTGNPGLWEYQVFQAKPVQPVEYKFESNGQGAFL